MTCAVVFAYHNVGVRCLSVLLAHGVRVPLVLTHADDPQETHWFDSVAQLAALHDIPVMTPDDPNAPDIVARVRAARPDFLFSFYYRRMLRRELLALPARGAFNMHGSLLPKYRGRVPVNWAIIHGETETGATLHHMTEKADSGAIVDQQAVPILPNDTAFDVFHKVTCAAEITLHRCLPAVLTGTAQALPQDLTQGASFGARRPEDGVIDWNKSAQAIHNLVRAVAPPYPGATTTLAGQRMRILQTLLAPERTARASSPSFYCDAGRCYADCGDGGVLRIAAFEINGSPMDAQTFIKNYGAAPIALPTNIRKQQ